jgi:hypothetical protein
MEWQSIWKWLHGCILFYFIAHTGGTIMVFIPSQKEEKTETTQIWTTDLTLTSDNRQHTQPFNLHGKDNNEYMKGQEAS